jgi:uncharacterized membrane protein YGL010W
MIALALQHYAADHRDPRNIALHCWGVPLVLAGLITLALQGVQALTLSAALLLSGGLLQALGHVYEGRRPRHGFVRGCVAPLFVGLQGLHRLGLAQQAWARVEAAAGPRRLRDLAQPA